MYRSSDFISFATALSVLLGTGLASAGGAETLRAEELFERGRALLDAKKYEEACAAFDESMRLEPAAGTLINLALCHELEGKLATAMVEYGEALEQAVTDGRKDRIRFAQDRLEVLSTRVARFTVEMDSAISAEVSLDGREVPISALKKALSLDPGKHHLVVSRPGQAPFEHHFEVPKEDGWQGSVQVPSPRPPASLPPTAPEPTHFVLPAPSTPREPTAQPRRTTWHWVGLGVGVLGLGTSAVTGIEALRAESDANENCIPERGYCSAESSAAADRANDLAWASTLSLGVGISGLAMWMWLPKEPGSTSVEVSTVPGGVLVTTNKVVW